MFVIHFIPFHCCVHIRKFTLEPLVDILGLKWSEAGIKGVVINREVEELYLIILLNICK